MPIVNVQVTREGTAPGRQSVTEEEKARLIAGVSQVLLEVLNKPLESTYVVIEEVDLDNWGWGGLPTAEYRKLAAAKGTWSAWGREARSLTVSIRKIGPSLLGKHVCGVPIGPVIVMLAPVLLLMLAMGSRSAPKGCCQIAAGGERRAVGLFSTR